MIYFDSAATTLQKPPGVSGEMYRAVGELASPGRGGHRASMAAAETAYRCREAAAELFHVPDPDKIVFTFNATHGLNMAIKSLAGPGDRVVVSGYEHNSVVRPLQALGAEIVPVRSELFEPEVAAHAFSEKITEDVRLVVLNHVSNVFGYIQPAERIAALCRERGVPFILDASQSAGALEVDMEALGADFIAMPGHKGLYGPQGTGLLLCREAPERTLIEGGTGSSSLLREMPDVLPDRLEAGTHNMPGIAGLLAGIRFVRSRGIRTILGHEQALLARAVNGMKGIPGVRLYAAEHQYAQAGVLSFNVWDIDCETVAGTLGEMDVACRAGLHCSPLAHETAGTLDTGTVRISFSAFNSKREVDKFLRILEYTAKKLRKA